MKLGIIFAAFASVALAVLVVTGSRSIGQSPGAATRVAQAGSSGPAKLTVAIYTPTIQFANSAARLSYVQGMAKAIAANTGIRVEGLSFTTLSKLIAAKPDFAIIDAQCYANNMNWRLLANARVNGRTSRSWALYSRLGSQLADLRSKKLAFVKTGCGDTRFIENAMLESELDSGFFSDLVGKSNLSGAVAEVATYRGAHAVFAPSGSQKGLTKVFDSGAVPTPAFVQLDVKLSEAIAKKVKDAVVGYGASSAIDGWSADNDRAYRALRTRMGKRVKRGLFADPEPVRIDPKEVLVEPKTLDSIAMPELEQNFERPPERQE